MPDGIATRLADDLWLLDTVYLGEPAVIASYLLTGRAGAALVDVGSGVSIEQLLAGVRAAGVAPEEIEHIVLTHIHLDHAGAAGALTRLMPRARVYVHSLGAAHLVDPTKLLSSAQRIYGSAMDTLWGTMEPVPADRLVILDDGAELQVGDRSLRALYTPGHAVHHLAYHDAARQTLFAGDVAGVRLPGVRYVRPPTPPPDLVLEDWSASIDRLAELQLDTMYLAHFGPADGVAAHLEQLKARLADWGTVALMALREGRSDVELAVDLAARFQAEQASEGAEPIDGEMVRHFELATNYLMSAQGYVRYYRKHHPELLG